MISQPVKGPFLLQLKNNALGFLCLPEKPGPAEYPPQRAPSRYRRAFSLPVF